MDYSTFVNVRDLQLTTEDLISLAEDNGDILIRKQDLEAIAIFVQTSLRVDAIGIAEAIRTGDYSA